MYKTQQAHFSKHWQQWEEKLPLTEEVHLMEHLFYIYSIICGE